MGFKRNPSFLKIVVYVAFGSRILVLSFFGLWINLANSYDTSSELNSPCLSPSFTSVLSRREEARTWGVEVGRAIERSIVWDGVYYVRIAECGYEYEQSYAFLPGLPLLMRTLSYTVFSGLIPMIGLRATLTLSGYLISNISFIIAAIYLLRLSTHVLEDRKLAVLATSLFCFNPASAFYSGIYSESLFSMLSFAGLWYFLMGAQWTAAVLFGLSSGIRSNGVLHGGFFLFQAMHAICKGKGLKSWPSSMVAVVLVAVLRSAVAAACFIAFQAYGFFQLCHRPTLGQFFPRPWCDATVPYLYGFVQSYYWNVGFLRYFEVKQLPNFVLASPMVSLAMWSIITYAKHQPFLFFTLGISSSPEQSAKVALWHQSKSKLIFGSVNADSSAGVDIKTESFGQEQTGVKPMSQTFHGTKRTLSEESFFSPASLCFMIQLGFMAFVATFVMHVQVATRFLSVSPALYWYAAHVLSKPQNKVMRNLIWPLFLGYISVGTLLFINFYPFT